jgi:FkbM family methyltransferase
MAWRRLMQPYSQPPPYFSQWGEDRWLANHFVLPAHGVFVDVGAGDGVRGSNTLYFENLGWSGLVVDADPRNAERLQKRACFVETCAVASEAGTRQFGAYAHKPSWSGLERHGTDYHIIQVRCERLDALLKSRAIGDIDLLSIDVEGTELDVWDSMDPSVRTCAVLIVEFDDKVQARSRAVIQRHIGATYELIHETPANLIVERKDRRWTRRAR